MSLTLMRQCRECGTLSSLQEPQCPACGVSGSNDFVHKYQCDTCSRLFDTEHCDVCDPIAVLDDEVPEAVVVMPDGHTPSVTVVDVETKPKTKRDLYLERTQAPMTLAFVSMFLLIACPCVTSIVASVAIGLALSVELKIPYDSRSPEVRKRITMIVVGSIFVILLDVARIGYMVHAN